MMIRESGLLFWATLYIIFYLDPFIAVAA